MLIIPTLQFALINKKTTTTLLFCSYNKILITVKKKTLPFTLRVEPPKSNEFMNKRGDILMNNLLGNSLTCFVPGILNKLT